MYMHRAASMGDKQGLVIIEYADLVAGKDLSEVILRAFGTEGLGALAVRGIPNYAELRAASLAQSHKV